MAALDAGRVEVPEEVDAQMPEQPAGEQEPPAEEQDETTASLVERVQAKLEAKRREALTAKPEPAEETSTEPPPDLAGRLKGDDALLALHEAGVDLVSLYERLGEQAEVGPKDRAVRSDISAIRTELEATKAELRQLREADERAATADTVNAATKTFLDFARSDGDGQKKRYPFLAAASDDTAREYAAGAARDLREAGMDRDDQGLMLPDAEVLSLISQVAEERLGKFLARFSTVGVGKQRESAVGAEPGSQGPTTLTAEIGGETATRAKPDLHDPRQRKAFGVAYLRNQGL